VVTEEQTPKQKVKVERTKIEVNEAGQLLDHTGKILKLSYPIME
jgi:hypothetical protein